MGRKSEQAGWEAQLGWPKNFDQLLEELHNQQSPEVYSELGLAFGWRPEPIPSGMISRVMAAIVEEERIQLHFNRRIFKLTGIFATVLFFVVLNFLTRIGSLGELVAYHRMEVGLFLLLACLGVGMAVLTVSLLLGEGVSEKRLG